MRTLVPRLLAVLVLLALAGPALAQSETALYLHRDGTLDAQPPTSASDATLTLGVGGQSSRRFESPPLDAPLALGNDAKLALTVTSATGVEVALRATLQRAGQPLASATSSPLAPGQSPREVVLAFPSLSASLPAGERVALTLDLAGGGASTSRVEIAYDSVSRPAALRAAAPAVAPGDSPSSDAAPTQGVPLPDVGSLTAGAPPWLLLALLVLAALIVTLLAGGTLARGARGATAAMAWGALAAAPLALGAFAAWALAQGVSATLGVLSLGVFGLLSGAAGLGHVRPGDVLRRARGVLGKLPRVPIAIPRTPKLPVNPKLPITPNLPVTRKLPVVSGVLAAPEAPSLPATPVVLSPSLPAAPKPSLPVEDLPPSDQELDAALRRWGVTEADP